MSEKKSTKIHKTFRCQFFLDFFGFIAFSGVSQRWESKNTTKNVLQKNRVEKFLQKKSKTNFLPIFFNQVFGRFSVRGVFQNTIKKHGGKNDPGPFLASDPPTHHGGHRLFFLPAPWSRAYAVIHSCRGLPCVPAWTCYEPHVVWGRAGPNAQWGGVLTARSRSPRRLRTQEEQEPRSRSRSRSYSPMVARSQLQLQLRSTTAYRSRGAYRSAFDRPPMRAPRGAAPSALSDSLSKGPLKKRLKKTRTKNKSGERRPVTDRLPFFFFLGAR
jgi:hypothetical protein